jgi:hypothetical protein
MKQNRCKPNVEKSNFMKFNPDKALAISGACLHYGSCSQRGPMGHTPNKFYSVWIELLVRGIQYSHVINCQYQCDWRYHQHGTYICLFCCNVLFLQPTEVVGEKMNTVLRKAMHALFKLHPKDVTGEILFRDVGKIPPSLTQLSKLVSQKHSQQLLEAR